MIKRTARQIFGKDLVEFLGHSGNYVTAALLVQGLSVITLPLFTRLLTPADFGILAILASFIAILNIIYRMGIQESVMRYYHEVKNDFASFFGSSLLLSLAWAVLLTFLLISTSGLLADFFNVPPAIIYIGIAVAFFYVFFGLYEGYLVASKNSRKAAMMAMGVSIITVVVAVLLILQMDAERFYGKAYAILLANILLGVVSIVFILKKSKLTLNSRHIRYALLFGIPLVFHSFSNYLLKSFDVIIINQLVGAEATGLYSVAYKVGLVQAMISLAMLKAWYPLFFEKLNGCLHNDLDRFTSRFASIVYLCAFALILFARELMFLLTDSSFHEALGIIPIIVMAHVFLFLFSIYLNFSLYQKKTSLVALITLVAAGLNIGLNYWLIPRYGYYAAAWTTLVAYLCLFIMHYLTARFLIGTIRITPLRLLLPDFTILTGFVGLYLIAGTIENNIIYLSVKILLMSALAAVYFRRQLSNFFAENKL